MSVRQVTNPSYEPITRAQAKLWCRVTTTDDDDVIDTLIKAAREYAENLTGRVFIQRSIQLILPQVQVVCMDGVNRIGFELPYPPLISVDSVTYIDTDGTQQTLDSTEYDVHTWREPGVVIQDWNVTWPSYRTEPDAWRITYTAGYAPGSPSDEASNQEVLPAELKVWMKTKIATLYDNRAHIVTGTSVSQIPRDNTDGLLDSLIVGSRLF